MFMQDYGTETCGGCGIETCDSHIMYVHAAMVQRPVATVVQRLMMVKSVHAGLWYRDLWRLWYRGLWWLNLFMQDYGTETCGGYPGSLGYLSIDAQAARPYIKYLCAMLCLMLQRKVLFKMQFDHDCRVGRLQISWKSKIGATYLLSEIGLGCFSAFHRFLNFFEHFPFPTSENFKYDITGKYSLFGLTYGLLLLWSIRYWAEIRIKYVPVRQTFADWEMDYVKMDGCNSDPKVSILFLYFLFI
jgi:hypothetical protein